MRRYKLASLLTNLADEWNDRTERTEPYNQEVSRMVKRKKVKRKKLKAWVSLSHAHHLLPSGLRVQEEERSYCCETQKTGPACVWKINLSISTH